MTHPIALNERWRIVSVGNAHVLQWLSPAGTWQDRARCRSAADTRVLAQRCTNVDPAALAALAALPELAGGVLFRGLAA
jgi:hypothetical protein